MEQGRHGGNVLAHLGKARKGFIIGDHPLVYIMGHGTCAPTVSTALDLPIELHAFLHKLESCFLDLPLLGFQLLHPHARWGRRHPLGPVAGVASSMEMLSTYPSGVPIMKHS